MRLFLEPNVVLDLLGERKPFYRSAAQLATLGDKGKVELIVSALTFTTVFYLLSKHEPFQIVKEKI